MARSLSWEQLIESLPLEKNPANLTIGKELNRGAWGVVYDGVLDRDPVAVKAIHEVFKGVEDGDTAVRSFFRECDKLKALEYKHVIKFLGAFKDAKLGPILVMEKMKENLRQFLERHRDKDTLTVPEQLRISLEITNGVAFLHQLNPPMVHRDLNDKNVMFTFDEVTKIGDFGQSKLKQELYLTSAQPGMMAFMPPEALKVGNSKYDESLDMFSLGVLMLEIGTQQPPTCNFVGIGITVEVERRETDLRRMSLLHPLKPFILLCLSDSPKQRPKAFELHMIIMNLHESQQEVARLRRTQQELEGAQQELSRTQQELEGAQQAHTRTRRELSRTQQELEEVQHAHTRAQQELEKAISAVQNLSDSLSAGKKCLEAHHANQKVNQRGNPVQISEKTMAENVVDPSETPEVIQAVYKLIVAVDIGTTYTKVAWCWTVTSPAEPKPHLFVDGQWEEQCQVPTAVLYRPSQHRRRSLEFDSFGHEAMRRYREGRQGWALFWTFKMDLHQKKDFDKEVEVRGCTRAGGTVTLPAVRVFCDILVHIKVIVLEHITTHETTYKTEDIKWVLTVPAMWRASARDVMRQAAKEAQIYQTHAPRQLAIALEPESAALHVRSLQSRVLTMGSAVDAKRYIVVDIGGGTIDAAVHAIECHEDSGREYVHEEEGCIGSANGATVINKKFEDFLCDLDIPGYPKVFSEMRRNPQVWSALMDNFESSKVKYNGDAEMQIELPACMLVQNQKKIRKSLVQSKSPQVYVHSYITEGSTILHVSPDKCLEWYELTISSTVELVGKLNAKHHVEALFVVGGFAKCKILQQRLEKEFPALQLVVPEDPGFAVIQGAVRYGPLKAIASRTSYATYGIGCQRPFRDGDDPSKKFWSEKHQSYYCKDSFLVCVTTGQKVSPTALPCLCTFTPSELEQTEMAIPIYATDAPDPKYIDDPGCVKIGTLSIDIVPLLARATAADDNREVTVKMDFSGPEICVTADDNTGQYHSEQMVDFLPSHQYHS